MNQPEAVVTKRLHTLVLGSTDDRTNDNAAAEEKEIESEEEHP
eukprot:CAMPEP_0194502150 /NCGR_PEP_ID=MMETSP0253-20130528/24598_1 /TAXON_ID=2966 /ORGANISM="Noctiluca scintillans" /LENGTH=42 /DNA_ID= /DNA_START= /DNA_END= /DNA_ORIENTATION=